MKEKDSEIFDKLSDGLQKDTPPEDLCKLFIDDKIKIFFNDVPNKTKFI